MKSFPAALVEDLGDGRLRCGVCPHGCTVSPDESGKCLTRLNSGGQMQVTTYGQLRAAAVDPIEKKPLFHYKPGSSTFSIASAGCNLVCPFCQNHGLSQALRRNDATRSTRFWSPSDVVEAALSSGSSSISFTYSEPILMLEFARDVAQLARPRGLDLVFVTNGQASAAAAKEIAGVISAANVDLKSFVQASYKNTLDGNLRATLRTIELFVQAGIWVEITTLVIPGFNDSEEELRSIAGFIKEINPAIPWHVSRFHPDCQWLDRKITPTDKLRQAREIGIDEGLHHVYVGNLPGDEGEKTHCPGCNEIVIERLGYRIIRVASKNGRCQACKKTIAGVEMP
ncbi:MAG: AmmeMemoRadiSam system radical SAM enzyme [Deltaproteobacteria bacterium]|nr:AmmeMemoRadiSam system radical SAM enzyme [Deltaproteobacteria bacterium]